MMNMFKTKSKGRQHALLDEVFQRCKLLKKKKEKEKDPDGMLEKKSTVRNGESF